jgi:DNA-binding response OmpR family regulator
VNAFIGSKLYRIVVLSANGETEDKVLLLGLGANDYVTKVPSPKKSLGGARRTKSRHGVAASATPSVSVFAA